MPVQIPQSHPAICLADSIKDLSQDFLNSHGLAYFQYRRLYTDGSFLLLATHPDCFLDFLGHGYRLVPHYQPSLNTQDSTQVHLLSETLSSYLMVLAREKHNLYHGITFTRGQKGYGELISYAISEDRRDPVTYFLNTLGELESYGDIFVRKARHLLDIAERDKISLVRPPEQKFSLLPEVNSSPGKSVLTMNEREGLMLFYEGKTFAEIAQALSIPLNKVLPLLSSLKEKLGAPLHTLDLSSF